MDNKIINQHADYMENLHETYIKKNTDYGSSFDDSLDKFGSIAGVIRISDKYNRLVQLVQNTGKGLVNDESMSDTLLDMANYAIMMAMWLERNSENKSDVEYIAEQVALNIQRVSDSNAVANFSLTEEPEVGFKTDIGYKPEINPAPKRPKSVL